MEHATYAPRLRFLDARDVDDSVVNFDGLEVRGRDDDKLGDIDGFIVDSTTGRVYYIVVDAGGWFASRRFLLPIGHAEVERGRKRLNVDVAKDALKRYPRFEEDQFRAFTDDELGAFERRTAAACCPDEGLEDVSVASSFFETRRHYRQPSWWGERSYNREQLRPVEAGVASSAASAGRAARGYSEDEVREEIRAREPQSDDVSPHYEGRAQPGDVLGIETGGERTGVGDTAEDENRRRRDAEQAVRNDDEPRRSDR